MTLRKSTDIIKSCLINVKQIVKLFGDKPEQLNLLINFADKTKLLAELKAVNGFKGLGLKRFDALRNCIAASLHLVVGCDLQGEDLGTFRSDTTTVRQKGRLLIALRTAAVIVSKGRASEVEGLKA